MPWLHSSANKVQTNMFCCCLIVNYGVALHRTCYTIVCIVPCARHGIFWGLIFGPGIFLGFAGSPRDFLGLDFWLHSIIPLTWNSKYPPWVQNIVSADFTLQAEVLFHHELYTKVPFASNHPFLFKYLDRELINIMAFLTSSKKKSLKSAGIS